MTDLLREYLESTGLFQRIRDGRENITASCPFATESALHRYEEDRHPSWGINKNSGLWHCFTCKAGGNLPQLIQRLNLPALLSADGVLITPSFQSRVLALREKLSGKAEDRAPKQFPLPASFRLFEGPEQKSKTLQYLYKCGYEWASLVRYGIGYDAITGDVIYPIADEEGYQLAWQRRSLRPTESPYFFPPEFDPSSILFNYDWCKTQSEHVAVVEGIKGAIITTQWGIPAVAAFKAHLSERQAVLLVSSFSSITIMFDGDIPGQMAQISALRTLKERAVGEICWVKLPNQGKKSSPDDFPKDTVINLWENRKRVSIRKIIAWDSIKQKFRSGS